MPPSLWTVTHPVWSSIFRKAKANAPLVSSMVKSLKAEDCRVIADNYFKEGDLDMAIISIAVERKLNPQLVGSLNYFEAYGTHMFASKMKNWYAVLGFPHHSVGIGAIKERCRRKLEALHPENCSSIAAKGATELTNAAWQVLSNPTEKKKYDDELRSWKQFQFKY